MARTLLIVYKRLGNKKLDGSPYLILKALVPVGEGAFASGLDVVEQFVDPAIAPQITTVPGTYEYESEARPMNGRLSEVVTGLTLLQAGFPS